MGGSSEWRGTTMYTRNGWRAGAGVGVAPRCVRAARLRGVIRLALAMVAV